MKKEDIEFMDWRRILIGEAPASFMAEVLLRCLILYPVLLVTVRLMGKRINGQLSVFEMGVMITLGAIVAPGMQLPDRGVLFSVTVLLCALLFHRGVSLMNFHHPWFQRLTQGPSSLLVKNGVFQLKAMKKARISRQQLCGILREKGFLVLGAVERAWLDSPGLYSIFRAAPSAPGLLTLPAHGDAPDQVRATGDRVCGNCGMLLAGSRSHGPCPECGGNETAEAYTDSGNDGKK